MLCVIITHDFQTVYQKWFGGLNSKLLCGCNWLARYALIPDLPQNQKLGLYIFYYIQLIYMLQLKLFLWLHHNVLIYMYIYIL